MITRIWQGKKEWTDRIYYVGQVFIADNGTFRKVTEEYDTKDQARGALVEWIVAEESRCAMGWE